ncbi:hypothetical protein C8R45DRAFT_950614 [Mycena sanguinolenta]|nr:hypothetical protein C8R45DRAFT_950614 [Mycena sanguinolenta]
MLLMVCLHLLSLVYPFPNLPSAGIALRADISSLLVAEATLTITICEAVNGNHRLIHWPNVRELGWRCLAWTYSDPFGRQTEYRVPLSIRQRRECSFMAYGGQNSIPRASTSLRGCCRIKAVMRLGLRENCVLGARNYPLHGTSQS